MDGPDTSLDLTQEQVDEHLAHYGVKGQKWGVRRERSNGGITKFKGSPKKLTDEELTARIKRLETEKKYKQLNKRDIGAGQKHINDVLVTIGKDTAKKAGTGLLFYGVKKALDKKTKIDIADAFPKKK